MPEFLTPLDLVGIAEGKIVLASPEDEEELFGPPSVRPRNLLGLTLFDLYPNLSTEVVAALEDGDLRSVLDKNPLGLDLLIQLSQLLVWRCEFYRREVVGHKSVLSEELRYQLGDLDKELRSRVRAHKELLEMKSRQESQKEMLEALKLILERIFVIVSRHVKEVEVLKAIGEELGEIITEKESDE